MFIHKRGLVQQTMLELNEVPTISLSVTSAKQFYDREESGILIYNSKREPVKSVVQMHYSLLQGYRSISNGRGLQNLL